MDQPHRSHRQMRSAGLRILLVAAMAFGSLIATAGAWAASTTTVSITSRLEPATVTVTVGDTVVWRNDDGTRHRVESTSGPREFKSDDLESGQAFSVTFTVAGTYRYVDHRNDDNPAYWGTVTVVAPGGGTPPAAPSPSTPSPSTPAAPSSAQVGMAGRRFSPGSVTIAAGGTVQWTNDDGDSHTVSAGAFDSGVLSPGRSFTRTFPAAGSFAYSCQIHPDMRGTVTVATPAGSAPATSPPPPANAAPPAGSNGTAAPVAAPAPPGATAREVAIVDLDYSPRIVSAAAGDTISWVNRGRAIHTATADGGSFDSGIVAPGGRFSFRASAPGSFTYHCVVHPAMRGTVTVVARGVPSPAVVAPTGTAAAPIPTSAPSAAPAPGPAGAAAPASASVAILDFEFSPPRVRVAAGGEVTWANSGAAPHTATARDQSFDSGMLSPDGTFRRRFDTPGTYDYICLVHPNMFGVVEVGDFVAGALADTTDDPLATAGTGSAGSAASLDPKAPSDPGGGTVALAAGVSGVTGNDGGTGWAALALLVALIVGGLAWAGFGPPLRQALPPT